MKLKKVNYFFGTSIILIGILRVLEVAFIILNIFVKNNDIDILSWIATPITWFHIIIMLGSIVMVFLNMKEYPNIMGGYLLALFAFFLELVFSGLLIMVYAFFESAMYLKAGTLIREKDFDFFSSNEKNNKKKVEETNWFFEDK